VVTFYTIDDASPEALTERGYIADRGLHSGWGLLIDGSARHITGLTDAMAYLEFDDDGVLAMATEEPAGAFAVLRRDFEVVHGDDGAEVRPVVRIQALTNEPPLVVIERESSYRDREWPLLPDREFVVELEGILRPIPQSVSDMEGAKRGVFRFGDRYFEIIVFEAHAVG
jgi:hypothetical protein